LRSDKNWLSLAKYASMATTDTEGINILQGHKFEDIDYATSAVQSKSWTMYIQYSVTILTGQFPWVEQVSRSCTNIWLVGKLFVTTCPSFQLLLSKVPVPINYQVRYLLIL
jgi:hypothetical protein